MPDKIRKSRAWDELQGKGFVFEDVENAYNRYKEENRRIVINAIIPEIKSHLESSCETPRQMSPEYFWYCIRSTSSLGAAHVNEALQFLLSISSFFYDIDIDNRTGINLVEDALVDMINDGYPIRGCFHVGGHYWCVRRA